MKTLIVIGGATASGKTDIAIEIAKHFHTEILSADSRQCYREMNIGVAKPDTHQLNEVKHFFVNSHSIHEEVSAGEYERYGQNILEGIFQKSDFAVCVGGTGLYIKALCEGIDDMPPVNKKIDIEVNINYQLHGIRWLQEEMVKHDPFFFEQGENQNPNRMIRALVFKLSTGESILKYRKKTIKKRDFAIKYFALGMPREKLYERINMRVDNMMADGLEEEVKSLIAYKHLKPLQTVGYTELFDYFEHKISSLPEAVEKIKQHTRNYAKRQITWFKHQNDYIWVQPNYENIIQALNG